MKYEELRRKVQEHLKYNGCIFIDRSPLINKGYPGNFNLSFSEEPLLKEYGKLIGFDHDYIFSTIQSCIRIDDLEKLSSKDSWKYLLTFEMADLDGIVNLAEKPDYKKLQKEKIFNLVNFLESLGIDKNKIYVSYCKGGDINTLSNGKYSFDFYVSEDTISKQAFLEARIPDKNLIPDNSRNTFLCLHVQRKTPWGYRNEINVNIRKENLKFIDISTIEYFLWEPVFNGSEDSKNIVGLKDIEDGNSINVVGLERLCMVINKLKDIKKIDYLKSFYEKFDKKIESGESLRALHRIYSDITSYNCKPSIHHKKKIRKILQNIPFSIDMDKIKDLLLIHSETQPWHNNLINGIEPTIDRIKQYRMSINKSP